MTIHFTGHNVEVTPVLKEVIEKKFSRVKPPLTAVTINIILTVENLNNLIEATFHLAGKEVHASGEADDMYKAIDVMMGKVETQVRKIKEKRITSRRER